MTDPAALLREHCKCINPSGAEGDLPDCCYCTAAEEVDEQATAGFWGRAAARAVTRANALEAEVDVLRQRAEKAEAEVERLRGLLREVLGPETDPQPRAGEEQR